MANVISQYVIIIYSRRCAFLKVALNSQNIVAKVLCLALLVRFKGEHYQISMDEHFLSCFDLVWD